MARAVRGRWAGVWLLAAGALTGCQPAMPEVEPPRTTLAFDAGTLSAAPQAGKEGCWASHLRPARFETVTEQRQTTAERRDASGVITTPARFASETHQREVEPRRQIWFRTPCPEEIGRPDVFTASLQRALKARGFFGGAVTGVSDPETEAALRRYQAAHGLDTATLSLAAARALGLVATLD